MAYKLALEQIPPLQRSEKPDISLRIHASIRRQLKEGETDPNRLGEWLKAPHSKFGDGDNLADYVVPTRLNKLVIFEHGPLRGATPSCSVLSGWVAKW